MNQQVQQVDIAAKLQQLLAKCWADEAFKMQMLADPMATLKAEGVTPPAGLTIKVVENTADVQYLIIPLKPSELSDDDLEKVAGGGETGQAIGAIVGGIAGGVGGAFVGGVGAGPGAVAGMGAGALAGDVIEDVGKWAFGGW